MTDHSAQQLKTAFFKKQFSIIKVRLDNRNCNACVMV